LASGRLTRSDKDDVVIANHAAGTVTILFAK
jgi:hypothetical protein